MPDNNNTFDAIVIGSGMSGGWAAKELCEKGLKTLVLERGRDVKHLKDYPTTNMMPWEFKHRGQIPYEIAKDNPVISRCYAFKEDAMHFFVKDTEHPYVQEKPFDWIRGYQVGGKALCGQGKHSAGAILILKARPVMALRLIGLSVIRILRHGIVMLKNLQASAAIKMDWIHCPMENFCLPGN